MALSFNDLLFVKRIAQPPERKRQLARIMDLSLPVYQFGLRDSEVINSASLLRCVLKMLLTMSIEMRLALQPMPARL